MSSRYKKLFSSRPPFIHSFYFSIFLNVVELKLKYLFYLLICLREKLMLVDKFIYFWNVFLTRYYGHIWMKNKNSKLKILAKARNNHQQKCEYTYLTSLHFDFIVVILQLMYKCLFNLIVSRSFVDLVTLTSHRRHELETRIHDFEAKCDRAINDLKNMKMKVVSLYNSSE